MKIGKNKWNSTDNIRFDIFSMNRVNGVEMHFLLSVFVKKMIKN